MCAHVVNMVAACPAAIAMPPSGFKKPIVMTGSQLPLSSPRSDARQNLIDALTCATASFKVSSSSTKSRRRL
jgi:L-asparaginase/Glu-tRNA(Gln) amidotransferase subunit D